VNDIDRANMLVPEYLIQEGVVLYFKPFVEGVSGQLVLSEGWMLDTMRDFGEHLVSTDCKVNTLPRGQLKMSTTRAPTANGFWTLVGAWLAFEEDTWTVQTAFKALQRNVPCKDAACTHEVLSGWQNGIYTR